MKTKYVVSFAGVPGTSKTLIANYLSWNFNLPIFSNDEIRKEITQNNGKFDQELYEKTRDLRLGELLSFDRSFIYDASVDRRWSDAIEWHKEHGFEHFVINLDLSRSFVEDLLRLNNDKIRHQYDRWYAEHENFMKEFRYVPKVTITDKDFINRLEIVKKSLSEWLNT